MGVEGAKADVAPREHLAMSGTFLIIMIGVGKTIGMPLSILQFTGQHSQQTVQPKIPIVLRLRNPDLQ